MLAEAATAEGEGHLEDAADWLLAALEHESGALRRREIESRRQALLDRLEAVEQPWPVQSQTLAVTADEAEPATDLSFRYETLITMLSDEARGLYENRQADFQQALVDLNEGRSAEALEAFERLVEAAPTDPALRLERGRARLLSGDATAAQTDLAAAWEALGDAPLDTTGSLLVPALWAEAALAAGHAEEVTERLDRLATPATGDPELCRLFATALLATGRLDRALEYLEEVLSLVPGDPELNLLMAQALAATGDTERAIAGLEQAIAPSCAAGGCARPAAHLPSFRLLARLHLHHGGDRERTRELMALVANQQRGRLGPEDLTILAEFYTATGDHAAAENAAAEALRLAGGDAAMEVDLAPESGRIL